MTTKQRIEELTNTWLGFTVFAAVASVVEVALWPFSTGLLFSPMKLALTFVGAAIAMVFAIGLNVVTAAIGLLVVRALGRALLRGSSLVRVVLLVVSPLFALGCAVSALELFWGAISGGELSPLVSAAVAAVATMLYVRSFKVLLDPATGRIGR
jgi:hypothetical protein